MKAAAKYIWIGAAAARSNLAYAGEVVSRTVFLGILLYIFVRLWSVVYAESNSKLLGGLALTQMVWYLVITESIVLSGQRIAAEVDDDVRTGRLAVQLLRPVSYPIYRLAVTFGYGVYILLVRPDPLRIAMFVGLSISAAAVFIGFDVLTASLGFYLGNSAVLSEQLRFALITFSTYPATLFDGAVKIVLFTVIPAAFVSYLPVQALRGLSVRYALFALGGSLAILAAGAGVFYHGLKRYESGNLLAMRE